MTGFGLYLVILYIFGICANLFYAGRGGNYSSPGVLIFGAIWAVANVFGIIVFGTGTGI